MAETVISLFKAEIIPQRGPWRSVEDVEFAVLGWVDWFNNRRLLEPFAHVSPAEFEKAYHGRQKTQAWRWESTKEFSEKPGAVLNLFYLNVLQYETQRESMGWLLVHPSGPPLFRD